MLPSDREIAERLARVRVNVMHAVRSTPRNALRDWWRSLWRR